MPWERHSAEISVSNFTIQGLLHKFYAILVKLFQSLTPHLDSPWQNGTDIDSLQVRFETTSVKWVGINSRNVISAGHNQAFRIREQLNQKSERGYFVC